jgi:hypothetical protein
MVRILYVILFALLWGCESNDVPLSDDCRDITAALSMEEFEQVKSFILQHGDRAIYCNMYNENPHYAYEGFDAYLNPEVGQLNLNCDPSVSDFNEIVIQKRVSAFVYYYILLVRKGDLEDKEIAFDFLDGMKEKKVYLLRYSDYDLDEMEQDVLDFILDMKNEIEIK